MKNTKTKGNHYEDVALQYLLSNGFTFIDKNFYSKYGEIDLVMQKDNILHFIEVKYAKKFNPLYNITEKKLEKLMKTIDIFLNTNDLKLDFCIDALSIYDNHISFIENITI
ncbi:YraN family protein [Helicobacter saguini]|uniref:UPF0102 protein DCO61_01275 n=1 Tax=Helicobacter saguini TaxID=1548018 RepID=A0A347VR91_9HELI|nr:YraN family protein [Helicobacter saguini]MWV62988.1 YraN family protein [Helicobacter saguini]MWV66343.1 YraN family protein [Helicobacter saguini]MWV68695.1 YraN family protein [Helicobacter saguini]MWV71754.1 YraN family protein [Helicobacter saguini]TLD91619.1 YraN family protein [Helicobacter saguini]